jgi:hypothetical protein
MLLYSVQSLQSESSGSSLKLTVHAGCCYSESFLPDRFTRALLLITAFVRSAGVLVKCDHFELRVVENIISKALFNPETLARNRRFEVGHFFVSLLCELNTLLTQII